MVVLIVACGRADPWPGVDVWCKRLRPAHSQLRGLTVRGDTLTLTAGSSCVVWEHQLELQPDGRWTAPSMAGRPTFEIALQRSEWRGELNWNGPEGPQRVELSCSPLPTPTVRERLIDAIPRLDAVLGDEAPFRTLER